MSESGVSRWREYLGVALIALGWLGLSAWARPLALPDEGRYAGVAWEMLRSGDWLTPTLDGLPFFHKPPLFYWITGGAFAALGVNEFAARVASMLGAAAAVVALYAFVARWRNVATARASALVLLALPLWTIGGQYANLDMLVAGCISVTILSLAHAALCVENGLPYRRALAGAYAAAAFGMLAKGLIGVVLPALAIALWLAATRRWRTLLALLWLPGVALFALIAAPWFVAMQSRHAEFFDYFFVVQHFKRFAAGGFNNVMPFWFYPAVLALATLPWWPWLRPLLRRGGLDEPNGVRALMVIWLGAIVVFFSLPASKLVGYVFPAVPALAFLVADAFVSVGAPSRVRLRAWWASAAVAATVSLGLVATLTLRPLESSKTLAHDLAAQRGASDRVLMLGHFAYDVPIYARLPEAVAVVDRWDDPGIARHDNWRKELADAGRFAPASAARILLTPASLRPALCATPIAWIIGPAESASTYPFLQQAQAVAGRDGQRLWKLDRAAPGMARALGCEGQARSESND